MKPLSLNKVHVVTQSTWRHPQNNLQNNFGGQCQ